MTLRTLNLPGKVLSTCFLLTMGIGYLFALTYLYLMDIEPHSGEGHGLIVSVIQKYYGQREKSELEAALEGEMGADLTKAEKTLVLDWIKGGSMEAKFVNVQPIFTEFCVPCHSPASEMPISPLTSFEEVVRHTAVDMGLSIKKLVGVSHIHLFGMSFIFVLTGLIFSLSEAPAMLRSVLLAIPFIAIWVDIGSWWLTKYEPVFALSVIVGGVLMGIALAGQIGISLYDMWFRRSDGGEA